jgi:hypothetical protein
MWKLAEPLSPSARPDTRVRSSLPVRLSIPPFMAPVSPFGNLSTVPVSAPTDDDCMARRWQPSSPWDSQPISNSLAPRVPQHTISRPIRVVATAVWAVDGEEHIDTEAVGWTGQTVYVRLADPRCRTNAIWLDGADVERR